MSRKPPRRPRAKSGADNPAKVAADAPAVDSQGYVALVADLKRRITEARLRAALSVNRELVLPYLEYQARHSFSSEERGVVLMSTIMLIFAQESARRGQNVRGTTLNVAAVILYGGCVVWSYFYNWRRTGSAVLAISLTILQSISAVFVIVAINLWLDRRKWSDITANTALAKQANGPWTYKKKKRSRRRPQPLRLSVYLGIGRDCQRSPRVTPLPCLRPCAKQYVSRSA